jgi:hypothetical protein
MRISAKDALMHPYFRPLRRNEETQQSLTRTLPGSAEKAASAESNGSPNKATQMQVGKLRGSGDITFQK